MSETKIYYVRESLTQSILSDITTFGFLCASVWFNETFCNGSGFMNGVLLVMFLIFLISKFSAKKTTFKSEDDLVEYLIAQDKQG